MNTSQIIALLTAIEADPTHNILNTKLAELTEAKSKQRWLNTDGLIDVTKLRSVSTANPICLKLVCLVDIQSNELALEVIGGGNLFDDDRYESFYNYTRTHLSMSIYEDVGVDQYLVAIFGVAPTQYVIDSVKSSVLEISNLDQLSLICILDNWDQFLIDPSPWMSKINKRTIIEYAPPSKYDL